MSKSRLDLVTQDETDDNHQRCAGMSRCSEYEEADDGVIAFVRAYVGELDVDEGVYWAAPGAFAVHA